MDILDLQAFPSLNQTVLLGSGQQNITTDYRTKLEHYIYG
jgi:hypothetical protein